MRPSVPFVVAYVRKYAYVSIRQRTSSVRCSKIACGQVFFCCHSSCLACIFLSRGRGGGPGGAGGGVPLISAFISARRLLRGERGAARAAAMYLIYIHVKC